MTVSRVRRRNYGRNHAYYLATDKGEVKLDGVTSLLSDGLPKPALINWASKVTAEYAINNWDDLAAMPAATRLEDLKGAKYRDVDQAAKKGTEIHDLAEKLLNGFEVEVPDPIRLHVENAARFLDEYQIDPILSETTVFNDDPDAMYAGTMDMLVTSTLPEFAGLNILADWKTSRSGIYDEAALQLSAYRNAKYYVLDNIEIPMPKVNLTWGVWIRSDGYDVYELDTGATTYRFFQHIATVARRARALKEEPLKSAALAHPMAVAS